MIKRFYQIVARLYGHVAAILVALSVLAFIGHFIQLDWHSVMLEVFNAWNNTVRPAMKVLLTIVIVEPLRWMGIRINIPDVFRDYIAVGLSLLIAGGRAELQPLSKIFLVMLPGKLWPEDIRRRDIIIFEIYTIWKMLAGVGRNLLATVGHLILLIVMILTLTFYLISSAIAAGFRIEGTVQDGSEERTFSGFLWYSTKSFAEDLLFAGRLTGDKMVSLFRSTFFLVITPVMPIMFPIAMVLLAIFIVLAWPLMLVGSIFTLTPIGDQILSAPRKLSAYRQDEKSLEEFKATLRANRPYRWQTAEKTLTPVGYLLLALAINYFLPV